MTTDNDLKKSLAAFIRHFEYVFDGEWNDFTKELLYKENVDFYISPKGTFLNPKVDDEGNNWGNRQALLTAYRQLAQDMKETGIYVGPNDRI